MQLKDAPNLEVDPRALPSGRNRFLPSDILGRWRETNITSSNKGREGESGDGFGYLYIVTN